MGFFYFLISFSSCSSFSLAIVTNIPIMCLTCSRGRKNSLVCISKHHLQYQICCVCNLRNTFLRCGLLSQHQGRNSWSSLWCRMQLFSGAGHIFDTLHQRRGARTQLVGFAGTVFTKRVTGMKFYMIQLQTSCLEAVQVVCTSK